MDYLLGDLIKNVCFQFFDYEMHFFIILDTIKRLELQIFFAPFQLWGWGGGGRGADKTFSSGKFSGILQKLECYLRIEGLDSTILGLKNTCLPSSPFLVKQSVTFNPLSPKSIKWSDTFKQFVG